MNDETAAWEAAARPKIRWGAITVVILGVLLLLSNCRNLGSPVTPGRANAGSEPRSGRHHDVALRFAPYVFHETDPTGGRQDLISNIDFDGDWIAENNWENFDEFQLRPTLYYAVLETRTHYFVSYHLFHPRDWNRFTLWLNDTHENDGENLQVVVRKQDLRVILLFTQAHFRGFLYTEHGTRIEDGNERLRERFMVLDDKGNPVRSGQHVAVFVEAQGHGIYGTEDPASRVRLLRNGEYSFARRSGLLFRPALPGEPVHEPVQTRSGVVPYRLDSTLDKLWPLIADGHGVGNGRTFDGETDFRSDWLQLPALPRYYDADRFSGLLGSDRGISPFALDVSFDRDTVGALFFDPASRYPNLLNIAGEWGATYIDYPFVTADATQNRRQ